MGISACTEFQRQQKFHQSHQLNAHNKMIREIQIPPRRLHRRHLAGAQTLYHDGGGATYMFMGSSDQSSLSKKHLPFNDDDDEKNPFTSDYFRMYEFKVRMCPQSRGHDWSSCPFAHPGERAQRRDPQKYRYTGTICPEFRDGYCSRGESCEFAHGVFEYWLHPTRYRTEACKDGRYCCRRVCFFAHTPSQLRLLPEEYSSPMNSSVTHVNHCCGCCHHSNSKILAAHNSTLKGASPEKEREFPLLSAHNSTLKGASPEKEREFPLLSRYRSFEYSNAPAELNSGGTSYADNLTDLLNSLEAMKVHETSSSANKGKAPMIEPDLKWISDMVDSVD